MDAICGLSETYELAQGRSRTNKDGTERDLLAQCLHRTGGAKSVRTILKLSSSHVEESAQ